MTSPSEPNRDPDVFDAGQAGRSQADSGSPGSPAEAAAAGDPTDPGPPADTEEVTESPVLDPDAPEEPGGDAEGQPAETVTDIGQQLRERTLDLQRLQAEYVNYKRRVERDRELVRENATYSVLAALLPVLDTIDRAREHDEVHGGFKAVAESLERVVAGLGLTKYGASGDQFDPNLHEALMHGHSAEVTTTVCDHIAEAGYRIGDRVVRAAKVTVLDPEEN